MPSIFISYSTKDQNLADFVFRHLKAEGVEVFMAAASLSPGQDWAETIKQNLRASNTVIVLASKASISSPFVLFEAGGAFFLEGKKIIPIIWDIEPTELPAWLSRYQALDLRRLPHAQAFVAHLHEVAEKIKRDQLIGLGIVGALIFALAKLK